MKNGHESHGRFFNHKIARSVSGNVTIVTHTKVFALE